MNIELFKKKMSRDLAEITEEFMKSEDIVTRFGTPQVAYINAEDLKFDMLFTRDLSDHPKKVYRPGKTIIAYYVPFGEEVAKANEACEGVSPEWARAHIESIWLAMRLNRKIATNLDEQGRLHSHLNTMIEWSEKKFRGDWNHKAVAAMSELGKIGFNGSFIPANPGDGFLKYGGRCGGIITDGLYAEPVEALSDDELQDIYEDLMATCGYQDAEGKLYKKASEHVKESICLDSQLAIEDAIAVCPCGAVTENGVDRAKCQEFCKGINATIPEPDVCGKCFKIGINA